MQYSSQQQPQIPGQNVEMLIRQNQQGLQISSDIKELRQQIISSENNRNSKCFKFGLGLAIFNSFSLITLIVICSVNLTRMREAIDDTQYVTSYAKHWLELYEAAWKSSLPEDMRSFLRQDYATMFDYVGKFTKSANTQLEEQMGENEITSIINLITSIAEKAETMKMMNKREPENGHEVIGPIPEILHWGAEWLIEQIKVEHWVGLGLDCKSFLRNVRQVDWKGTYKETDCPEDCNEETDDCSCTSSIQPWDFNSEIDGEVVDMVYDVCNGVSKMK
tara:strand:+ start:99 stop:929 length:831 start_codon:yes stop_codon:yes gene_type:complete